MAILGSTKYVSPENRRTPLSLSAVRPPFTFLASMGFSQQSLISIEFRPRLAVPPLPLQSADGDHDLFSTPVAFLSLCHVT